MKGPSAGLWDWLISEVRAGAEAELMPRFRRLTPEMVQSKSHMDDLVTDADRRMEARLQDAVARHLPDAVFLGEEAVSSDPSLLRALPGADLAIVCDPLDGTWNFANGLAVFGVILAVLQRGEPVFGLLYDPIGDDWVAAERGAGTFFQREGDAGVRLSLTCGPARERLTGFVPLYLFPVPDRPRIAAGMARLDRCLSLRCSCHEYRMLVQGKVDFNLSINLQPWDHIAGLLAVTEAGGVFAGLGSAPYRPASTYPAPLIAASGGEVMARSLDVLDMIGIKHGSSPGP